MVGEYDYLDWIHLVYWSVLTTMVLSHYFAQRRQISWLVEWI